MSGAGGTTGLIPSRWLLPVAVRQVEYTEQIRVAREKASKAVAEYRKTTEDAIEKQLRNAQAPA
eukprot:12689658-Alexandrium_andersonii.AAC.1